MLTFAALAACCWGLGLMASHHLSLAHARDLQLPLHSEAGRATLSAPLKISLPPWVHFRHTSWPNSPVTVRESAAATRAPTAWHSQSGEDKYAYEHFFNGMPGGSYLELGALNGVQLSNTKSLHDQLGWRGLLIEANPTSFRDLTTNRPLDLCVNAAICETPHTVHYAIPPESNRAIGGIWELMSPAFKKTWYPNVQDVAGFPEVTCEPLGAILKQFGIRHIDFFSLDVEGGELDVLRSIDWDFTRVSVIVVEADGRNKAKDLAVRDFLVDHGFQVHGHVNRNDWFVASDFMPSSM